MFSIKPIGTVRAQRALPEDDFWGNSISTIELVDDLDAEALLGLEDFSHAEVLYLFDQVDESKIVTGARRPRNNQDWPRVGIFAQRAKNRPNRLGSTIVKIVAREGRKLVVAELDAIDGTPVIDIKPVMQEFLPRHALRQPEWSRQLMAQYWLTESSGSSVKPG